MKQMQQDCPPREIWLPHLRASLGMSDAEVAVGPCRGGVVSRFIALVYGSAGYLLFLATFLYAS